jgi:ABC-type bacteriocin/lantibiotic exporter with double-glycine peptidase domain
VVSVASAVLDVRVALGVSVASAVLDVRVALVALVVLVAWGGPAALVVLAALAVSVALGVSAVPAISGSTIRPIEVVLLMVIAVPQTDSAARREVIH